jgi:hypothetical protein
MNANCAAKEFCAELKGEKKMCTKIGRLFFAATAAVVACEFLVGCSSPPPRPPITVINAEDVAVAGRPTGKTYMGLTVTEMPFLLAGNETRYLPITSGGPIPAENQTVKIEVSGLFTERGETKDSTAKLTWVFGFSLKQALEIDAVQVEQVFPSAEPVPMLKDVDPMRKITKGGWSGSSPSGEMSEALNPWFFRAGGSVFVYKFTITPKGAQPVVLFQPTWISEQAKQTLRAALKKPR